MSYAAFQLQRLQGKLIVSCQALVDEELYGSEIMAKMALAAKNGGAAGIRANSPEDIAEIRKAVQIPVIGLWKRTYSDSDIYITPTLSDAKQVAQAGASIVAMDATLRRRPGGEDLQEIVAAMKASCPCLLMADVSTVEEGVNAAEIGFDIVSTTLSGYTPYSKQTDDPDFELVAELSKKVDIPVFAEGRIRTLEQAASLLKLGAYAIVVGAAITKPRTITRRFADQLELIAERAVKPV
ncbi:N-acetylmannosamine-6-phosphate 2-epimerase [Cohnella sp. 56]|uniref:N-acetylmannosamine-6-phosphate 2-epimerase n=1 Tax=Cohnella sp. 56 TaxID=3113722 RepID=UPI0030EA5D0D